MAGWLGVLWLVAGCSVPGVGELPGTCQSNADCAAGAVCDVGSGICYAQAVEEPDGGSCSPACAEYEACVRGSCRPRFTGVNIVSPVDNSLVTGSTDGGVDGGAVQVVAELVANSTFAGTPQYPASLSFSATLSGGVNAGTFGAVVRSDGTYTVPWIPPMTQGPVTLTAAYPAAGLSHSVNVTVDTEPPGFDIAFSAPPSRAVGNVTVADQRDLTSGFEAAFRKDEFVTVTVSANEAIVGIAMTVVGIGSGGNPGRTQTVPLQPASTCGTSPFCVTATVDLSTLEMNAFRGLIQFRVEGQDGAGNRRSAAATLPVTRWKWAYDGAGNIVGSPAVGSQGTVYIGTNLTTGAGKLLALNPDGSRKWEAAVGDVSSSPAVGAFNSGEENVYTAGKTASGSFLYALRGSVGTERVRCTYANATEVPGSIAVGATSVTIGTAETGVAIYNGSPVRIVGIRPDASPADRCPEVSGTGGSAILAGTAGSSLVMRNETIFYAAGTSSPAARITSYEFGSNIARAGFPQSTNQLTRGIALSGDKLFAGANNSDEASLGSLFTLSATTGGAITSIVPSSRVFNLAIGSGDVAYFGAETATTAELVSLPLSTTASPTRASGVDILRGAPVIGRNDRLYTVNAQGKVSAWVTSTLTPLWNVDVNVDLSTKDTSPTLDCKRDAGGAGVAGATTGTLYFVGTTKLYAFIVDSPSLAANAPWPKYQRDARNTGNPASPITNCPQ